MNIQYPITITNNVNFEQKCLGWKYKTYPITIILQSGEEITGITKINKSGNFLFFNDNVIIIQSDSSFTFKDSFTNLPAIVSCRDINNTRLTNYCGYDSRKGWLKYCPNCQRIMPLTYFDYNGRNTGEERDQSQCSECRSRY